MAAMLVYPVKLLFLSVVLLTTHVSSKPQIPSFDTQVLSDVRLVNGEAGNSGRVEVLVDDMWGYVCAAMFDDYDAKVVCRQLGYDGDAFSYRDGRYGPVVGPHHLTEVDCSGEEQHLQQCSAGNITTHCLQGHASVRCFENNGIVDAALESILPGDCGRPVDAKERYITRLAKIREGAIINRFQTPWVATLSRASKPNSHFCGATVISSDYLITAAHCVDEMWKADLIVTVGEHRRDIDDSQHQDFEIDEIKVHEHYKEVDDFNNDIALIQIKRSRGEGIRFSERVQPVCLPKTGTQYQGRTDCTLTGWGRQFVLFTSTQERLSASINVLPLSVCVELYNDTRHTSSMVCAAPASGKLDNPCGGDSGSPLTCQVESGISTLMGLVSHGSRCGFSNEFADKYTRVEKYLRWILQNISKDWERIYLTPRF